MFWGWDIFKVRYFECEIFWGWDILRVKYFEGEIFWGCDILRVRYVEGEIFWGWDILRVIYFEGEIFWWWDILRVRYFEGEMFWGWVILRVRYFKCEIFWGWDVLSARISEDMNGKILGKYFWKPCEWKALELCCVFSLLSYQPSHPPLNAFGGNWGKMGFGLEAKTHWSTPSISLRCIPSKIVLV